MIIHLSCYKMEHRGPMANNLYPAVIRDMNDLSSGVPQVAYFVRAVEVSNVNHAFLFVRKCIF